MMERRTEDRIAQDNSPIIAHGSVTERHNGSYGMAGGSVRNSDYNNMQQQSPLKKNSVDFMQQHQRRSHGEYNTSAPVQGFGRGNSSQDQSMQSSRVDLSQSSVKKDSFYQPNEGLGERMNRMMTGNNSLSSGYGHNEQEQQEGYNTGAASQNNEYSRDPRSERMQRVNGEEKRRSRFEQQGNQSGPPAGGYMTPHSMQTASGSAPRNQDDSLYSQSGGVNNASYSQRDSERYMEHSAHRQQAPAVIRHELMDNRSDNVSGVSHNRSGSSTRNDSFAAGYPSPSPRASARPQQHSTPENQFGNNRQHMHFKTEQNLHHPQLRPLAQEPRPAGGGRGSSCYNPELRRFNDVLKTPEAPGSFNGSFNTEQCVEKPHHQQQPRTNVRGDRQPITGGGSAPGNREEPQAYGADRPMPQRDGAATGPRARRSESGSKRDVGVRGDRDGQQRAASRGTSPSDLRKSSEVSKGRGRGNRSRERSRGPRRRRRSRSRSPIRNRSRTSRPGDRPTTDSRRGSDRERTRRRSRSRERGARNASASASSSAHDSKRPRMAVGSNRAASRDSASLPLTNSNMTALGKSRGMSRAAEINSTSDKSKKKTSANCSGTSLTCRPPRADKMVDQKYLSKHLCSILKFFVSCSNLLKRELSKLKTLSGKVSQ